MSGPRRAASVLVVEDDAGLRSLLTEELEDRGFRVAAVRSAEAAWEHIGGGEVDLVLSDLRLPGVGGDVLLAKVRTLPSAPGFIVITAYGTVSRAVEALKAGADDFITKPLDLEHLAVAVDRALETRRLRRLVARYEEGRTEEDFHGLLGKSPPMRRVFDHVRAVARSDGAVLVQGESGVGKELVARAIHLESDRSTRPFVAVNCAGVPETLLESEFFGHTRGAFTGARRARRGLFEEAGSGTIFLDEVAEMSAPLQAKLLRVLQEGVVRPLGSNAESPVDVRVIAATNRDLEEALQDGSFREDLFYRLATFQLEVPPLRERGADLDLLVAHFVSVHAARQEKVIEGITQAAMEELRAHAFPGNVRELENALHRAVTFCPGGWIEPAHLPPQLTGGTSGVHVVDGGDFVVRTPEGAPPPPLEVVKDAYIRHVLARLEGNKRKAASALGIGRRTLYRRLDDDTARA